MATEETTQSYDFVHEISHTLSWAVEDIEKAQEQAQWLRPEVYAEFQDHIAFVKKAMRDLAELCDEPERAWLVAEMEQDWCWGNNEDVN